MKVTSYLCAIGGCKTVSGEILVASHTLNSTSITNARAAYPLSTHDQTINSTSSAPVYTQPPANCSFSDYETISDPGIRPDAFYETYKWKPEQTATVVTEEIATVLYELIRTMAPGEIYEGSDGIKRYRPTASPTETISETVTVFKTLHNHYRDKIYNAQAPVHLVIQKNCREELTSSLTMNDELNPRGCKSEHCEYGSPTAQMLGSYERPQLDFYPYKHCDMLPIGEAILFHWPPTKTSSSPDTSPVIIVSSSIIFDGQDMYPRVMIKNGTSSELQRGYIAASTLLGPFTFTSPTVYLAHREIMARITSISSNPPESSRQNFNEVVATDVQLHPAGLRAVEHQNIYSVRHFPRNNATGAEFVSLVASGKYDPGWNDQSHYMQLRPMNFSDLANPVPASVYYEARSEDCYGRQTHCAIITDDTYRPKLFIKDKFWSRLFPPGFECNLPLINDPPRTIKGLVVEDESDLAPPTVPYQNNAPRITPPASINLPHVSARPRPTRRPQHGTLTAPLRGSATKMTNPPSGQNRESRGNRGSGDGKSNEKGENKSNGRTGRGGPGRSGGESDKEPGDSTDSDLPQDGTSQGERTKGGRNKSDKRKGERTHDGETQPRQHDESEEFDDGRPSKPARGSSTHSGQSWPGEGEQSDGASVRPGSGNAANSVEDDGDHRKSSLNHGSSPRKKNDGSSLKMNLIGTLEQLVWTYFLYRCIVAGILG